MKKFPKKKRLTVKYLEKLKIPKVLIAGLIVASVLGWTGWTKLAEVKNYYPFLWSFKRNLPISLLVQRNG